MAKGDLKFDIAPHIVEDLGLNLYTNLPRVLVEFIANAYDADSPDVNIEMNPDEIADARKQVKADWQAETAAAGKNAERIEDLETRTLPVGVTIRIEDHGHGMSRDDLQKKFLNLGRRRRKEEGSRSPGQRILMGRKGLGKLAGFGAAHRLTVTSRKKGESHSTQIELDFENLVRHHSTKQVVIPTKTLASGLRRPGTTIVLSRLVYDPLKSELKTISNAIAEHFAQITPEEFAICLNGSPIAAQPRDFVYAHPKPEIAATDVIEHSYTSETGRKLAFSYRIRFTGEGKHLQARERGVRIYAHKRLAAASDLLDLGTGIHGFRNTHYLDAVAYADFIDDQQSDYIATDRQTLRWESPLLVPMRRFLTEQMKVACQEYQKVRDENARKETQDDPFTRKLITAADLPKHRERLAYRVAALLVPICEAGVSGKEYKQTLGIFVDGLGQGTLLQSLATIAKSANPDIRSLVGRLSELTAHEFGDFIRVVQGRLSGIDGLQKLVESVNFRAGDNEADLHNLFKRNPWLIDPTFTQFLTSNESEKTLNVRLATELKVGDHVPANYDKNAPDERKPYGKNKRPDLTFVISNKSLMRVVIVELKAPNTPLHGEHLRQLQGYIRRTTHALNSWGYTGYRVQGLLIGSRAAASTAEDVLWLNDEIDKNPSRVGWGVYDILEVLETARDAHRELLDVYRDAAAKGEFDDELEPPKQASKKRSK